MKIAHRGNVPRNGAYLPVIFLLLGLNVVQLAYFYNERLTPTYGRSSTASSSSATSSPSPSNCRTDAVNDSVAVSWGCRRLEKACLDHGRIILHSGHKTPGHERWTNDPVVNMELQQMLLPGYAEPLGTTFFFPCANNLPCGLDVRAPTPLDPIDVQKPKEFDSCRIPLLFVAPYFSNFAEFFLNIVSPTSEMKRAGLVDERTVYTAYSAGMDPPPFYNSWLEPYLSHTVESIDTLSSREHIATGKNRCFAQLMACNIVGLYSHMLKDRTGITHGHWELHPVKTGGEVAEYYKDKFPEKYIPPKKGVFQVVIGIRTDWRKIINLDEILKKCNAWVPPKGSPYKRTKCISKETTSESFVDDVLLMQRTNALVMTHSAGATFSFTLPEGSALVEIMGWDFCGYWSRQYFEDRLQVDRSRKIGYFRLSADEKHLRPGKFEAEKKGSSIAWGRDRDIIVEFDQALSKALTKIALQQDMDVVPGNRRYRFFEMGEFVRCPYEQREQFPGWTDEEILAGKKEELPNKKEEEKDGKPPVYAAIT